MATEQYVYKITDVVKVSDGDTAHVQVDVGFHCNIAINIRLLGYDCPEKAGKSALEKAEAKRAQLVTTSFLAQTDGQLWVRTERDPDSFGRWLGDVWLEDADGGKRHLGSVLRSKGLASIWPKRWHEEFLPA